MDKIYPTLRQWFLSVKLKLLVERFFSTPVMIGED